MSTLTNQGFLAALRNLRAPAPVRRALAWPRAPLVALLVIVALSVAARLIDLNEPCTSPCKTPSSHTLIFDEAFYVNAARAIAGIKQSPSSPYAGSPEYKDPNAEHPQLAKAIVAGTMELFGDNPWGWRIGSVLFGVIAMFALYALVTGAGGSPWLAVGAVGVMALDNLALVHSRIFTLDIYAVAMMLVAGAFYVRRRPVLAGAALGVAMCMKEVAVYLLAALVLYEALRFVQARWGPRLGSPGARVGWRPALIDARGLLWCLLATFVVAFGLLWILDVLIPAWDPGSHTTYAGNPFAHFAHMIKVAEAIKVNPKNPGIASTPLQWLVDKEPINYARTVVSKLVNGRAVSQQVVYAFRGEINPFIIFLAIPALAITGWQAWRHRDRLALVGVSWSLGTYLPFFVQSELINRTSYLFYMLIVMPGIYLMTAQLFSPRYLPRLAAVVWTGLLVYGFVRLYPIRTLL